MSVREIDVAELARWRREGNAFVLLDVREPDERRKAAIDDALCIPMGEIGTRLHEIDRSREVAVLCHHGGRSAVVAEYLEANGFTSVVNVDGGIDEYARLIDPSIGRY